MSGIHKDRRPPAIQNYMLAKLVGFGSYGEVWLSRSETGVWRAVKIIYAEDFAEPLSFVREVDGVRDFDSICNRHEALVDVRDVGRFPGGLYYVMELADNLAGGRDIDPATYTPRTLANERGRRGRLCPKESIEIGIKLAEGLQHLHDNGLLHRDLKPSNVIFVNDKPKLADPGLVARAGRIWTDETTRGFSPSEGPNSKSADVYALGKVLYETVTGMDREAFSELPVELRSDPDWEQIRRLWNVLCRACHPEPNKRFGSAKEFHEALEELLAPIPSPPAIPVVVRVLAGLFVVLLLTGLTWWWQRPPPEAELMGLLYTGSTPTLRPVIGNSLTLKIQTRDRQGNHGVDLRDGDEMVTGRDYYSLTAVPATSGYLYVFQLDSSGRVSWLYPANAICGDSVGTNPVAAGEPVRVPAKNTKWLELDHRAGHERLFAVLTVAPWSDLQKLLERRQRFQPTPAAVSGELLRGLAGTSELPEASTAATLVQTTNGTIVRRWFRHSN